MTDHNEPVSIYKGSGFYRKGRRIQLEKLSYIVQCKCELPDGDTCEYVMTALSAENANTIARMHVRTVHPERLADHLWLEQIREDILLG
jgi:hypothetical protein